MLWRVGGEFGNAISVGGSTCVRWKFSRWRGRPPTAQNERGHFFFTKRGRIWRFLGELSSQLSLRWLCA